MIDVLFLIPDLEKIRKLLETFIYLSICLSVYLSVCLSVCLSMYLSVCLSVCLSVRLPLCLPFCLSVIQLLMLYCTFLLALRPKSF